jgi:hypothetical protein
MARLDELRKKKTAVEESLRNIEAEFEKQRLEIGAELTIGGNIIDATAEGQKAFLDYIAPFEESLKSFLLKYQALLSEQSYLNAEIFMDPDTPEDERVVAGDYLLSLIWQGNGFYVSERNPNAANAHRTIKKIYPDSWEQELRAHARTALFVAIADAHIPQGFKVGQHGKTQTGTIYTDLEWKETLEKIRSEARTHFEDMLVERVDPKRGRRAIAKNIPRGTRRVKNWREGTNDGEDSIIEDHLDSVTDDPDYKPESANNLSDGTYSSWMDRKSEHPLGFIDRTFRGDCKQEPPKEPGEMVEILKRSLGLKEKALVGAVESAILEREKLIDELQKSIAQIFERANAEQAIGKRKQWFPYQQWRKIANRHKIEHFLNPAFPLFLPRIDKQGNDRLRSKPVIISPLGNYLDERFAAVVPLSMGDIIITDMRRLDRPKVIDTWADGILAKKYKKYPESAKELFKRDTSYWDLQPWEQSKKSMAVDPNARTILTAEEEDKTMDICVLLHHLYRLKHEDIVNEAALSLGIDPKEKDDTLRRIREKIYIIPQCIKHGHKKRLRRKSTLRDFICHDNSYKDSRRQEYRKAARRIPHIQSKHKWIAEYIDALETVGPLAYCKECGNGYAMDDGRLYLSAYLPKLRKVCPVCGLPPGRDRNWIRKPLEGYRNSSPNCDYCRGTIGRLFFIRDLNKCYRHPYTNFERYQQPRTYCPICGGPNYYPDSFGRVASSLRKPEIEGSPKIVFTENWKCVRWIHTSRGWRLKRFGPPIRRESWLRKAEIDRVFLLWANCNKPINEPPRWIDLWNMGAREISMESLIRYRRGPKDYFYIESRSQAFFVDRKPMVRRVHNRHGMHRNLIDLMLEKALPKEAHGKEISGLLSLPFPSDEELAKFFRLKVETIREIISEAYNCKPPFFAPVERVGLGAPTIRWCARVNWEPGTVNVYPDGKATKLLSEGENPLFGNWNRSKRKDCKDRKKNYGEKRGKWELFKEYPLYFYRTSFGDKVLLEESDFSRFLAFLLRIGDLKATNGDYVHLEDLSQNRTVKDVGGTVEGKGTAGPDQTLKRICPYKEIPKFRLRVWFQAAARILGGVSLKGLSVFEHLAKIHKKLPGQSK